ncbi:MAG: YggS family pyridoxal phosphate-dependent enzyme [Verrucomicrobiae bacterium]|nr:YggS family pyridoxal phosphate-dependent enzyme [Verrucomicrobiae bacterium]
MSDANAIAENLHAIRERIAAAANHSGRAPGDITLVAVSKTFPAEAVRAAVDAGQMVFGENKVQEGIDKVPVLPESLEWHLIGHLQSNKIRKALPLFGWIETVDSLKRAEQIDRVAAELGLRPNLLLQVNIGQDDAKFGYSVEGVRADLESLLELKHVAIRGLMTIPPFDEDLETTRTHFSGLRDLRDQLEASSGKPLPELSMGMSHDFEIAVEEGATFVRVGSSIFGTRG